MPAGKSRGFIPAGLSGRGPPSSDEASLLWGSNPTSTNEEGLISSQVSAQLKTAPN